MEITTKVEILLKTHDLWANALKGYGETELLAQPKKTDWSLGQLYMHLIEETNWYLDQAETSLVTHENAGEEMTEKAKKMFQVNAFPDERVKGMATVDNVPNPINKTQLINDFSALRNREWNLIGKYGKHSSKGKSQHPGLGYFNGSEWIQYAEMHLRHHLRQQQRIEASLDPLVK